jgi:hypothetical protein
MDNVTAYAALVREMEALVRVLERDEGPLELEIHVRWQDAGHTALRLEGHARGASTWNHQHLQETLVVPLQDLG